MPEDKTQLVVASFSNRYKLLIVTNHNSASDTCIQHNKNSVDKFLIKSLG